MTTTTNQPEPATDKQLKFIETLCAERGLSLANTDRPYGTKREASDLISFLMAMPRPARAQALPAAAAATAQQPAARGTVTITEPGIYERGGEVYRVVRSRESGNLYAKRMKVIGGMRATEAGTVVGIEFEYAGGAIFTLTPADRMTVERARELCLRYGVCINCGAHLVDAASVELGIGPKCILKFVGGAEALKAARKAAREAKKAGGAVSTPTAHYAANAAQIDAEEDGRERRKEGMAA